jgi:ABC-2 type transport system ATP-binding protein
MIHDPKVLILDEPTTGLDPNQLAEIRNLIIEIGKQKTVLLSTHIMQEVEAVCNRVIIINKGQVVANDKTSVLQNSQNENIQIITVEFDKVIADTQFKSIEGITTVKNIYGNTWQIQANTAKDIRSDVFQHAVKNGMILLTLQKEEQKLEDVFKQLTK